jgi:hypothetical protein
MSTQNEQKITKLLDQHRAGTVLLASWMGAQGVSRDLQKRYRKSGWLESIGTGAYKRPAEKVRWQGGLYTLQTQASLPIHAGAMTALAIHGYSQYLLFGKPTIYLFSSPKTVLPTWYRRYKWDVNLQYIRTALLPTAMAIGVQAIQDFEIRLSNPERAILECLHLAPKDLDPMECYQVLEGLANLRPKTLQELLGVCTSIKVKRLFLYLAEKAGHAWFEQLQPNKLDLGKGHRRLVPDGVYMAKYQLTVPKTLAEL